jgi:hypothetical protein
MVGGDRAGFTRAALVTGVLTLSAAALLAEERDASAMLERVGAYIETYYGHAQSIIVDEQVLVQPLQINLTADGFPRRVRNELRVEWDPSADPPDVNFVRRQVSATGPPIFREKQEDCADPPGVTPEPLSFLLPANQPERVFTIAKNGRIDGRRALGVDYRLREPKPPEFIMTGKCPAIDMDGVIGGRLWIDAESGEVLRNETHLVKYVDARVPREQRRKDWPTEVAFERHDISTRYRRVTFKDPDEALLLPAEISTLNIYRLPEGMNRLRITQTFSNYRRFVTGARIVEPE